MFFLVDVTPFALIVCTTHTFPQPLSIYKQVGSVFIARGVGAVLGAVVSSKLYLWMRGNTVMSAVLLLLTAVLLYMPEIESVYALHGSFFVLGLCTAITDTGCQIMTRKLHGAKAGPWLGANTVVFGISGALVPLIGYLTGSLLVQYVILSAVSCATAAFLIILPAPEKYEGLLEVSTQLGAAAAVFGKLSCVLLLWRGVVGRIVLVVCMLFVVKS